MTNIAIIGSREYGNKGRFDFVVNNLLRLKELTIITGGAIGVDTWAMEFCRKHNIRCEVIRPINKNIKISYLFRNIEIITKADLILAFWDEKSKGTKFVIDYAIARNKKIQVIKENGEDDIQSILLK
jgi:predicted Rossmann fold nucleotide-binding protein DprA/Smf involved in DNA uptake